MYRRVVNLPAFFTLVSPTKRIFVITKRRYSKMNTLTNNSILEHHNQAKESALKLHVEELRSKYPKYNEWTDLEIIQAYNDNNSYSQSMRCRGGGDIESFVEKELEKSQLPFARQVPINKDGIITNKKKGMKVIDIVFGNPTLGDHISHYAIMSLKKSSRERSALDDWTLVHVPKLYLYATLDPDYPEPSKFQESNSRKLVCAIPKSNDTRMFKLRFEDIVDEVRALQSN